MNSNTIYILYLIIVLHNHTLMIKCHLCDTTVCMVLKIDVIMPLSKRKLYPSLIVDIKVRNYYKISLLPRILHWYPLLYKTIVNHNRNFFCSTKSSYLDNNKQ